VPDFPSPSKHVPCVRVGVRLCSTIGWAEVELKARIWTPHRRTRPAVDLRDDFLDRAQVEG
jgi:hypothetical protein